MIKAGRWWPYLLAAAVAGLAQAWSLAWPFGVAGADWLRDARWTDAFIPQAGQPWPLLQGLALTAWLVLLRKAPSGRHALVVGWVFATAWLAGTWWWLYTSMHVYGGLASPLAALAVVALAAFLGSYTAAISWFFWCSPLINIELSAMVFCALWLGAELARGVWFTGFPWGAIGYAHVETLGALAPWIGVYGLGAVAAALSAYTAGLLTNRREGGRTAHGVRLTVAALWWLACLGGPAWRTALWPEGTPALTHAAGELSLKLLQGNIAQDEKFQAGSGVPKALDWYGSEMLAPAPDGTLVIAPETAIPVLPQQVTDEFWRPVLEGVRRSGHAVLTGVPLGNLKDGYVNAVWGVTPPSANQVVEQLGKGASLAQLDHEGEPPAQALLYRYEKHHLVPFGEFIPPLFKWFVALMDIPLGDFNRGTLGQPPLRWAGQRIAPNICYEDLFGEELARGFADEAEAPTVLVNVSNLAWFGNSVALDQHLHISRMRALELQRPMVRATNTGATVVIDHAGRVTHAQPRLTEGVLLASVQGREGVTPFAQWSSRWGLAPLWGLAALGLLVAGTAAWRGARASRQGLPGGPGRDR